MLFRWKHWLWLDCRQRHWHFCGSIYRRLVSSCYRQLSDEQVAADCYNRLVLKWVSVTLFVECPPVYFSARHLQQWCGCGVAPACHYSSGLWALNWQWLWFSIKVTNIVWIIMVIVVDVIVNISGYHTASISDLQMNSLYAVWFSVSLHDSRNVNMGPFCQVISIHCLRCPPCPLRLHQTWCPLKDCWCTSECIDSWKLSCYTDEAPEWADLRSFLLAASLCRNNSIDWTLLITLGVGMHLKG